MKINNSGNIVGWLRENITQCWVISGYWPNGSTSPIQLGNFAGIDSLEQTIAYGVNESSPKVVVGTSRTAAHALAWYEDAEGGWTNQSWVDLNDVMLSDCDQVWTLVEAFDVNDAGLIVGWGFKQISESVTERHAFVLIPTGTCLGDLTQNGGSSSGPLCPDGQVNVFDLFVLLSNWDTDGPGDITDNNYGPPDGVVNVYDLFALLSSWGECGDPLGFVPTSVNDCINEFGLGEEYRDKLNQCLEEVAAMEMLLE